MGKIIVQKFGGTSVQDRTSRDLALDHVEAAIAQGYKVVMVVSAMGRKGDPYATDSLFGLVSDGQETKLNNQELDQLMATGELISMSVMVNQARQRGMNVTGLTGAQAGIHTNQNYQSAQVDYVDPTIITNAFQNADVVVVAGFQGVTVDGHVTTLGRGGSDTSATAIGAAVGARFVDIFTDVDGVMDHDPKQDPNAQVIPFLTYEEMESMANHGAKVVHPRAVKIAMNAQIPFRVRSTYRVTAHGCTIIGSNNLNK
ncbi:hypothetical protein [uncultured Limosilactobacillus sp.]|uniref:amino acid kinase family protein n=1 Tax=uncultured Limosilactobacillus sp. TaxID=2837629 RepID=UPI0025EBFE89|nr:hypothetical protein [uncultured Limosilactobacillus sp.]